MKEAMLLKKIVFVFMLILAMALNGCSQTPQLADQDSSESGSPNSYQGSNYEIKITKNDYNFIIAQKENALYLGKLYNTNLKLVFYDTLKDESTEICTVENYMFSNNSVVEFGGSIYFFITTREQNKNTNHLYAIDTVSHKVRKIYSEDLYQTFNYLTVFNNSLLMTKGDLKNSDVVTYIEEYDVNTGESKIVLNATANHDSKEGKIILNITSNDSNLFVYYEKYESRQLQQYVDVFDKSLTCIESFMLLPPQNQSFFTQPIGNFKVLGNQLYLQDYSNAALLIERENPSNSVYYDTDNAVSVALCSNLKNASPVLYKRNSTDIYRIANNGELIISDKINFENGYVINNITQYGSSIILWLKDSANSGNQRVYHYEYSDLFEK